MSKYAIKSVGLFAGAAVSFLAGVYTAPFDPVYVGKNGIVHHTYQIGRLPHGTEATLDYAHNAEITWNYYENRRWYVWSYRWRALLGLPYNPGQQAQQWLDRDTDSIKQPRT